MILVFLDGVGVGPAAGGRNPLALADLAGLRKLTGGARPITEDLQSGTVSTAVASMGVADACLGVDGLPQSGTGQTALLTGRNAAVEFGRHFGPWVPTPLRDGLREQSLFQLANRRGLKAAFANAYPRGHLAPGGLEARRPGAFPLAAAGAGVLTRHQEDVRTGGALVSSITTGRWRAKVDPLAPVQSPRDAASVLSDLAGPFDLTVFAHYDTDYYGHRGDTGEAIQAIDKVDDFLGALAVGMDDRTLLLVVSDHGNIEAEDGGHTLNPVLVLAVGPGHASVVAGISSITDVPGVVLGWLD